MSEPRRVLPGWPLLLSVALLVMLIADLVGLSIHGGLFAEDDAYYYLVAARNIATTGVSTFDGQSLTNGYHPLWMVYLVLQHLVVGGSLFVTFLVEALLLAGGLFLVLRRAPRQDALACAAYALPFAATAHVLGMRGMEFSLFVFAFGLLVEALERARLKGDNGLFVGLAAAAVVGARIDAAVFVGPLVLLAPISWKARFRALALMAALGLVYGVFNLAVFGAATPISSAIKSLGGLQLNRPLLGQMGRVLTGNSSNQIYLMTLAALAGGPVLWLLSRPGTIGRALAAASTIGGALFVGKLVFGSSWIVWPWYNFALFPPLTAGLFVIADPEASWARFWPSSRWLDRAAGFGVVAVLLLLAGLGLSKPFRIDAGYGVLNARAVERFAPTLNGARVAMGDRAGSFAMAYPGGVVQLEGLMNDKAYFQALKAGGDVTGLLCRRQVKYVVDYEPEMARYDTLHIPVLRSAITQAKSASFTVRRQDEVGRLSDRSVLDERFTDGETDITLYVWRLNCPGAAQAR